MTLIGWGSTHGVIEEACELLGEQGISANQLQIRWLVPLHGDAILDLLTRRTPHHHRREQLTVASSPATCAAKPALSPTATSASTTASRSCRTTSWKRCKEQLAGKTKLSVPTHEIMV